MGLWPWLPNQILTPKFWKIVKHEGVLHAYKKPHRTNRNNQYHGGYEGALKPVGEDQFGNKYYEDLSVDYRLNARYVEHADHYAHYKLMDNIPPTWDGWLKYQYNEVPSENNNFAKHFYIKDYQGNHHNQPFANCPPGYQSIYNKHDSNEFYEKQIERKYVAWDGYQNQFQESKSGQALIDKKGIQIIDETENY